MPYPSGLTSGTGARATELADSPGNRLQHLDVLCFSHLRWDFVFQRPQHLLTRAARTQRVIYMEEAILDSESAWLELLPPDRGVHRAIPHLPGDLDSGETRQLMRTLVDQLLATAGIQEFVAWYYTPMAFGFTDHLEPALTVYDCMDELSHFKGAASELPAMEAALFKRADVVFTGGYSLYRAKRDRHANIHAFPSSIDAEHFALARSGLAEPADQADIPHPRVGYYGVIDERTDVALLGQIADLKPDWQFIMVGPVVKIDPKTLPQRPNIHYLGSRRYEELPAYLAGWDVAIMPFALNDATRYISPTKTLEYLAAGKPVVSTAITDVVHPYGDIGLVGIASNATEFIKLCEEATVQAVDKTWQNGVATLLASTNWDRTWSQMQEQLELSLKRQALVAPAVQTGV